MDVHNQRLEGAYFEASEGTEGLVDYPVHFMSLSLKQGIPSLHGGASTA
jgi:hypothetical protein